MSENIGACLRDFIHHVEGLKSEDDPAGTGFHREFRILREIQVQNKNEERFSMEDGKKEENVKKNRYKDILPRDDNRVKLSPVDGEEGSDFINATFIKDVDGKNGYIAAQGPMPHTVNDFWRMLWEYKTGIVFMACRTSEGGKPKCEKYWADKGKSETFGSITVFNEHEEEVQEHFMVRKLQATKDGQTHTLTQFQYEGWPDHDTPSSPDTLRSMIEYVRNHRKRPDIPMVIHCSAGCGRTGTICAIDYAWTLLDQGKIDNGFSLFEIIKLLREQRLSMVQTPDQYEYCHMVLKSLCEEWLQQERKHDYENVVIEGVTAEPGEEYCNVNFSQQDDKRKTRDAEVYGNVEPKTDTERQMIGGRAGPVQTGRTVVPEVVELKPKSGNMKGSSGSNTKPVSQPIASPNTADDGEGVYVMVQPKTITEQTSSPGSPPALPDKKNPPAARYDQDKLEPHKTVITFRGGGNTPKVTKTGSVGVAYTKARAPRPPVSTVVANLRNPSSNIVASGATVDRTQHQVQAAKTETRPVVISVDQKQTDTSGPIPGPLYENHQLPNLGCSSAKISDAGHVGSPIDDPPALPTRSYRPDEIAETVPAGNGPKHDSAVPASKGAVQVQSQAAPVVVSTGRSTQPAQASRLAHPLPSSHPTGMTGRPLQHFPPNGEVISAAIAPARRGSARSVPVHLVQTAPVRKLGHPSAQPRSIPTLVHQVPQVVVKGSASARSYHPPAHSLGKIVYLTERPARVRGPRPMPTHWPTVRPAETRKPPKGT